MRQFLRQGLRNVALDVTKRSAAAAKAAYWRVRFTRWPAQTPRRAGYSLLLPVPGDLPVFLELALDVCSRQSGEDRLETLVIPDTRTPEIEAIVESWRDRWPGVLRIVDLPRPERWILPWLKDPGRNHGVQLIAGTNAAVADHVMLHDADLFMLDPTLHDDSYRRAVREGLDVVGVEGAWDDWYNRHQRTLAATWEQLSRIDWLRSVAPHRHLGHDAVLWGERHTFDTTFWAQCHTAQDRIVVTGESDRIVHFNYVISTYRRLQRTSGTVHDGNFRLLLIRLFIDLFANVPVPYAVPELDDLAAAIGDEGARVHYLAADGAGYRRFIAKFRSVLDGPLVDPTRRRAADEALAEFEQTFGTEASVDSMAKDGVVQR
ncbi:MAG: hypothetical protein ACRYF3_01665 [Janthinobacterium lividum]